MARLFHAAQLSDAEEVFASGVPFVMLLIACIQQKPFDRAAGMDLSHGGLLNADLHKNMR